MNEFRNEDWLFGRSMRSVKVIMSKDAPFRPPMKVLVDGVPWHDVISVGWKTGYGGEHAGSNVVTLEIDAKMEVVYVDEKEYEESQKILAETKGT